MPKQTQIEKLGVKAKAAATHLAQTTTAERNTALGLMARELRRAQAKILQANQKDVRAAAKKIPAALLDRLTLNPKRLEEMAQGLEAVAALPDPLGKVIKEWTRADGLRIQKISIPLGVIGFIYESRPNVTSDAAGLCLKAGNAVILRGGSEAFHSNGAVIAALKKGLHASGLPPQALQMVATSERSAVKKLLQMDSHLDLIIPRGGEALIRFVSAHARVPVLKHAKGVCHIYIDESADREMAVSLALNAKVQRPGTCNAMETLLVHKSLRHSLLPRLIAALQEKGVEIRAPREIARAFKGVKVASPKDFGTEFLDLTLSLKVVSSLDEAIAHIQKYGSSHTESIVTEDAAQAAHFMRNVTSSAVMWNTSTRLADGGEMGFGAEIGISTSRLHAYGPMGIEELTSAHYRFFGSGHLRT